MKSGTYAKGAFLMAGYLVTATMVSIIEHGGFYLVPLAKTFFMFEGGILLGWLFVWIWGWPVWWATILLLSSWLGSIGYMYDVWEDGKKERSDSP
jgi:hypothetical protein